MTELIFWVCALFIVIGGYGWFFWQVRQMERERESVYRMNDDIYSGFADAARYVAQLPDSDFKNGAFEALAEIGRDIEELNKKYHG